MKTRLIAFTGPMGSGKSTAIEQLAKHHDVINVKLAGTLYDIQEFIYRKIAPVHSLPPGEIKDRKLLQLLGTEWGRNTISPTLWVDLWEREVSWALQSTQLIVTCDDVRFDNEAAKVKEMGGIIIKINSEAAQNRTSAGIDGHASEKGISNKFVDYVINNNEGLDNYVQNLNNLFKQIV